MRRRIYPWQCSDDQGGSAKYFHIQAETDQVVYDIGAGTGSVSVEAARSGNRIRVYAVEKKPEAVELLRQPTKILNMYEIDKFLMTFCKDGDA